MASTDSLLLLLLLWCCCCAPEESARATKVEATAAFPRRRAFKDDKTGAIRDDEQALSAVANNIFPRKKIFIWGNWRKKAA